MQIKKFIPFVIAFVCLSAMAFFMFSAMKDDSATTDEPIHVLSGYSYWQKIFTVNPEHPPLGKQIATSVLNLIKPVMPQDENYQKAIKDYYYDSWAETRSYAQKWLFNTPGNNADEILNSARTVVIIFTLILGIIIFWVSKKWFGDIAASVSIFLYSFSPVIITHGHLANTDLWMTLGFFVSVASFVFYLTKPNWKTLILAAICFTFALLVKFSSVLLIPILSLIWIAKYYTSGKNPLYFFKKYLMVILIFLAISLFLIWADYGFPIHFAPKFVAQSGFEYTNKPLQTLAPVLTHLPIPQYFKGLIMVFATSVSSRPAYLLGQFSGGGWWYYFPVAFAVKEPLALIIAIILGIGCFIYFKIKNKKNTGKFGITFYEWALIIPPAFYLLFSLLTKLNIGIRHIMPIYPFIFVAVGYLISKLWNKIKKYKSSLTAYFLIFTALLAAWYLWACISIYPYFMTYFNELAGGAKNGPKILVDSNIDWGQDTKRLANWIQQENIAEPIKMEYFWGGKDEADYYGINYTQLEENNSNQKGWIAIGVSSLQRPEFSWLKNYTPAKIIGNSVYVYHIE